MLYNTKNKIGILECYARYAPSALFLRQNKYSLISMSLLYS